jgi:hypothetical protein
MIQFDLTVIFPDSAVLRVCIKIGLVTNIPKADGFRDIFREAVKPRSLNRRKNKKEPATFETDSFLKKVFDFGGWCRRFGILSPKSQTRNPESKLFVFVVRADASRRDGVLNDLVG